MHDPMKLLKWITQTLFDWYKLEIKNKNPMDPIQAEKNILYELFL